MPSLRRGEARDQRRGAGAARGRTKLVREESQPFDPAALVEAVRTAVARFRAKPIEPDDVSAVEAKDASLTKRESCARAGIRRRYSAHQVPLKPYRDTTSSFVELRQLIDAQRWKDATRATRTALLASELSTSTIRELDAVWTAASMGRFGFSAQLRAAAHQLPPAGVWEDDCAYATRVGEAVGWRQATGWLRWRDVAWPSRVGPLLEIAGQASSFPEGCFPFHDAVTSDAWSTGFSPRDCWGTAAWTTWCRIWRSLDAGP